MCVCVEGLVMVLNSLTEVVFHAVTHTENNTKRNSFRVCVLFYTKGELLKNLLKLIYIQFPTDQSDHICPAPKKHIKAQLNYCKCSSYDLYCIFI